MGFSNASRCGLNPNDHKPSVHDWRIVKGGSKAFLLVDCSFFTAMSILDLYLLRIPTFPSFHFSERSYENIGKGVTW